MGFQCLPNVVSKQSISLSLSAALKRHRLKSFLTCSRSPKESIGGVQTRNGGRVHRKAALRTTMWMHAGTNRHDAGLLQSGSRLQGAPRLWGEPFGRFQPRCCAKMPCGWEQHAAGKRECLTQSKSNGQAMASAKRAVLICFRLLMVEHQQQMATRLRKWTKGRI